MRRVIVSAVMAVIAWASVPDPLQAGELAPPTGPVALEITGAITNTNAPGAARFDMSQLKALGVVTVTTKTPWADAPVRYEAVMGDAVLKAVGATGTKLIARAVNDYKVEVPIEDLRDHGAFLAFTADGKRLTARDKGPLWLLYPFSDRTELDSPIYYNRAVWQLIAIEVR